MAAVAVFVYAAVLFPWQVLLTAVPGFVLARRVGVRRAWLALVPVLMFAKISDCGQRGWRLQCVNSLVLGVLFPATVVIPASLNAREAAPDDSVATAGEVYWGIAIILSSVVCLGVWLAMWDGVCRATKQDRKVWLFGVPLVNFVMPWVIALHAKPVGRSTVESVIGGPESLLQAAADTDRET